VRRCAARSVVLPQALWLRQLSDPRRPFGRGSAGQSAGFQPALSGRGRYHATGLETGTAMNGEVSLLRPAAANPATSPELTDALRASVEAKSQAALALLQAAVDEFGRQHEVTFANSFGAEDMVLTDLILKHKLSIEIFSLDTG